MQPPRASGILETSLYVDDMARAVQFYQKIFAFQPVISDARITAMNVAPGQVLLIFKKKASPDHDGDGRLHLAFSIPASDLQAWEDWLAQNSISIVERRAWDAGGKSLYFRDPDGHLIEVATPGVWANY